MTYATMCAGESMYYVVVCMRVDMHALRRWAGSVERVCLSSPPPPHPTPHTPPPERDEFAGMKQFSGCAYHAPISLQSRLGWFS